jgi:hypothetical protein
MRRLFATVLVLSVLAAIPACAQQFPAGPADETTSSLGSFKIQITNANVAPLFAGCPGYNNPILSSPVMYDPGTVVGLSDPLLDGSNADTNGVAVGSAKTNVSEAMLFPPPGFPCAGATGACSSGANTRELHTEVRSLKMVNLGGGSPVVRAGLYYDSATKQTDPPSRVSPGEVESHSGPNGALANDLPASSFFDVFVQVDVPACGKFPGATLYNTSPLIVKNPNLTALPPKVVYLHDSSSVVPILFLNANAPLWNAGDVLGYFVLAGHGIGFGNTQSDIDDFNNFMSQQPVTCVNTKSATLSAAPSAFSTIGITDGGGGGSPSPSPSPTPVPQPSPTPVPSPSPSPTPINCTPI